jgi:hypothetical protein
VTYFKPIAVLVVLFLTGCSGIGYAMEHYKNVKPQQFAYDGQGFRIFDKPNEGRLMITPTIGAAMAGGATFGGANTPEIRYKQASLAYLASTGRKCKASDMKLVIQPQWETFYTCA